MNDNLFSFDPLDSLQGMRRAEVNPVVFANIQSAIASPRAPIVARPALRLATVGFALLCVLNILAFTLRKNETQAATSPQTTVTVNEWTLNDSFQLYN